MGCELFPGREAFAISPSQVEPNLGGCHAAAFLLVGTQVRPFSSSLLIFQKPTETSDSSCIKLAWVWAKSLKSQGDWKINASNETKQSQKPVFTKQRLNISFAYKQVLWLCGKFRGYFFCCVRRHAWLKLLQAVSIKGICTSKYMQTGHTALGRSNIT